MTNRTWIPVIGWTLCWGIFHNCTIVPFFKMPPVEWEYLLAGLGIILSISGVRDIGLKGYKHDQIPKHD
ncbi:MAG: hypothetical protein FWF01_03695 [Alphaproteobacteria bacterium]|nr:hypothetical protein [Alphaproteobacteria bacterium]